MWKLVDGVEDWLPSERVFAFEDMAMVGVMGVDFVTPPYLWAATLRPLRRKEIARLLSSMDDLQSLIAPVVRAEAADERGADHLIHLGFRPIATYPDRIVLERTL